jgi:hypothetical protein
MLLLSEHLLCTYSKILLRNKSYLVSIMFLLCPRSTYCDVVIASILKSYLDSESQLFLGLETVRHSWTIFNLSVVPPIHTKFAPKTSLFLTCYLPLHSLFVEALGLPPSYLRVGFYPYSYAVFVCLPVCLSMALQPFVGPWPLFQLLDLLHGRTPWMRDHPVARPLSVHRTAQTQ